MLAKTIAVLSTVAALSVPCAAQKELRALSAPIGANGKPCIGVMFEPVSKEQKNQARELVSQGIQYEPLLYKDATTKTLFYLESDRQHLSAINSVGKRLWTKAWNMCPYRALIPHIVFIGPAQPKEASGYSWVAATKWSWLKSAPVLRVEFDSSQFGLVNQQTGDFFFEGQN